MKTLITAIFLLLSTGIFSQITSVSGSTSEGEELEVGSKVEYGGRRLDYIANANTIHEFLDGNLINIFTVSSVTHYSDKIFYIATDSDGKIFGITFTFKNRAIFFGDVDGNFVEFSGEGLFFSHQY